jgi:hypothetical protein
MTWRPRATTATPIGHHHPRPPRGGQFTASGLCAANAVRGFVIPNGVPSALALLPGIKYHRVEYSERGRVLPDRRDLLVASEPQVISYRLAIL